MEHSPKLAIKARTPEEAAADFREKSRNATLRALRWVNRGNHELSRYWWDLSDRYDQMAQDLHREPEQ